MPSAERSFVTVGLDVTEPLADGDWVATLSNPYCSGGFHAFALGYRQAVPRFRYVGGQE